MRIRSDSSSFRRTWSPARSELPGAYDLIGSFCDCGGVKIPGALMGPIVGGHASLLRAVVSPGRARARRARPQSAAHRPLEVLARSLPGGLAARSAWGWSPLYGR